MKLYQPIDGLLGRRRRKRGRITFGVFGIAMLGMAVYWFLSTYRDSPAEARTDLIIALSSPDFTDVFTDQELEALEALRREPGAHVIALGRPHRVSGALRRNQTLFIAMRNAGVESPSIQGVVDSLVETFDFRRSQPGDEWEAELDEDGWVKSFQYSVSREEVYESVRLPDGRYRGRQLDIPVTTTVFGFGGTVLSSVHDAVAEAGEGTLLATRFMEIFRWDFDFSRQAQRGDSFRVVVEKLFLEGEFLRYGRVLAAEYRGESGTLRAFAYTTEDEETQYYTAEGEALRRMFLQAPLNYRRISSTFTHRRFHPILQRYRAHLGVDYAAYSGTPVWAIADGRVTFANERGGNGNLVVVQHEGDFESGYSHLQRFASGIRRGRDVRQGQVIGFVGSTGLATGPHLHFSIRHDGEYTDPLAIVSERGPSLRGSELQAFQQSTRRWAAELDGIDIAPIDLSQLPLEDEEELEDLPSDFGIVDDDIVHPDE